MAPVPGQAHPLCLGPISPPCVPLSSAPEPVQPHHAAPESSRKLVTNFADGCFLSSQRRLGLSALPLSCQLGSPHRVLLGKEGTMGWEGWPCPSHSLAQVPSQNLPLVLLSLVSCVYLPCPFLFPPLPFDSVGLGMTEVEAGSPVLDAWNCCSP